VRRLAVADGVAQSTHGRSWNCAPPCGRSRADGACRTAARSVYRAGGFGWPGGVAGLGRGRVGRFTLLRFGFCHRAMSRVAFPTGRRGGGGGSWLCEWLQGAPGRNCGGDSQIEDCCTVSHGAGDIGRSHACGAPRRSSRSIRSKIDFRNECRRSCRRQLLLRAPLAQHAL